MNGRKTRTVHRVVSVESASVVGLRRGVGAGRKWSSIGGGKDTPLPSESIRGHAHKVRQNVYGSE